MSDVNKQTNSPGSLPFTLDFKTFDSLVLDHLLQPSELSLLLLYHPLDVLFPHHGQETPAVQMCRWMRLRQDQRGPLAELRAGWQLTTGGTSQASSGRNMGPPRCSAPTLSSSASARSLRTRLFSAAIVSTFSSFFTSSRSL